MKGTVERAAVVQ